MKKVTLGAAMVLLALNMSVTAAERQWYATVESGVAWQDFQSAVVVAAPLCGALGNCGPDTSTDAGWALLGSVGTNISDRVRIEAELGYRDSKFGGTSVTHTTVMANALLDVPVASNLALSFGVGAGFDRIKTDDWLGLPAGLSTSETAFAYQGLVALNYDLSDRMDLTLTYRHLETTGGDGIGVLVDGYSSSYGVGAEDPTSDTLSVGLRFKL